VIHRHFLSYPGYREELVAREPSRLLGEKDVTTSDGDALIEYDLDLAAPLVERSSLPATGAADLEEPQTRRFAGWMAVLDAHRACRLGQNQAVLIDRARALVGDAPELSDGCDKLRSSFDH